MVWPREREDHRWLLEQDYRESRDTCEQIVGGLDMTEEGQG
jgi:hypothetical protein